MSSPEQTQNNPTHYLNLWQLLACLAALLLSASLWYVIWIIYQPSTEIEPVIKYDITDREQETQQEGGAVKLEPLEFSLTADYLKKAAPELYAKYKNIDRHITIGLLDVTEDGTDEIFIHNGDPGATTMFGQPIYVYKNQSTDGWVRAVQSRDSHVFDIRSEMGKVLLVRSPWGDITLEIDGNSTYDWLGEFFTDMPAGWDLNKWLGVKQKDYQERISPQSFTTIIAGDHQKIVSDRFRIAFELPTDWHVEGKLIHENIWAYPPGVDEFGLLPTRIMFEFTSEGHEGSWGHGHALRSSVDGTSESFEMLRAQADGYSTENQEGNDMYEKVKNLTISGFPAVRVHYWGSKPQSDGFWNDDITWIKNGDTNWYVVVTNFNEEYGKYFERILESVQIISDSSQEASASSGFYNSDYINLAFEIPSGFVINQDLKSSRGSIRLAREDGDILIRVNPLTWEHFGNFIETTELIPVGDKEEAMTVYTPVMPGGAENPSETEAELDFYAGGNRYDIWIRPYREADKVIIRRFLASMQFN